MIPRSIRRLGLVLTAVAAALPSVSAAQPGDLERVDMHIRELVAEAQRAEERGELARAKELRQEARAVRERTAAAERERSGDGRGSLIEIIEGLEHGMVALRKLGREEEAAHLNRIADGVRERVRAGGGDRPSERDVAIRQLEIMRMAMPALREAERRDAAEMLEHAMHARELILERRDDPEAMEIRRTSPPRGHIAEVLMLASGLWEEFGHESKAAMVGELGRHFAEQERARRERAQPERRVRAERDDVERRDGPGDERVAHLERRLDELAQVMERLHLGMRELEEQLRHLRERE